MEPLLEDSLRVEKPEGPKWDAWAKQSVKKRDVKENPSYRMCNMLEDFQERKQVVESGEIARSFSKGFSSKPEELSGFPAPTEKAGHNSMYL